MILKFLGNKYLMKLICLLKAGIYTPSSLYLMANLILFEIKNLILFFLQ